MRDMRYPNRHPNSSHRQQSRCSWVRDLLRGTSIGIKRKQRWRERIRTSYHASRMDVWSCGVLVEKEQYGTLSSPCSTAMHVDRLLVRVCVRVYVTYISGIVGLIGIDLSDSVAARILTEMTARATTRARINECKADTDWKIKYPCWTFYSLWSFPIHNI